MSHHANTDPATYREGYGQSGYGQAVTDGANTRRNHGNRSSSDDSNSSRGHKEKASDDNDLETIHTNELVGSHSNYYEKGGLRTEGDGVDHIGAHNKVRIGQVSDVC